MTCIIALEHKGHVYLGADSLGGSSGWNKTIRRDPKAFVLGDALIGFTTSYRMGQIIRYHMDPPQAEDGEDEFEVLAKRWLPKLREALKEHGYTKVDNSREEGGTFLLAWRGRVFGIHSDFQIEESMNGYLACGSGGDFALGALHASSASDPTERLRAALEAAEHFSAGVSGPFIYLTSKPQSRKIKAAA